MITNYKELEMCGEFDDEDLIDEYLFARLLQLASQHGVKLGEAGTHTPQRLSGREARNSYMTQLFQAGLTRAINDANSLPEGERMDVIAGQAIVFARLAGFLAGQLPPGADTLRPTIEALMEGYSEPVERANKHDHHHHGDHQH
ncbi:hypothetical protein [Pseudomonas agarici]|uniref:hypothetical protein n=1 Tax=Pseudomonas agarici TaxID=46677 RepID=UPI001B7F9110|nr:hypothetical protein [Pseudomonas agarici]